MSALSSGASERASERSSDTARAAAEILRAAAPDDLPAILGVWLDKGTLEAQRTVLEVLREMAERGARREPAAPPADALKSLWRRLAAHADRTARAEALAVAGRAPPRQALELLPLWLKDADASLRRHALNRLLLTAHPLAAATAVPLLDDPDAGVRLQAAYIMERFPCREAVPALMRLACGNDSACADVALQALLEHSPFHALLAAAAIERAGSPAGQLRPLIVFGRFTPPQLHVAVRQGIAAAVAAGQTLSAEDVAALVRRVPERTLDDLVSLRGPGWLRAALVDCDAQAAPCSRGALRRLEAACRDGDAAMRERAVRALARHDAAEPGTVLGPLLRHRLADVRRLAVELLPDSGPQATPVVRRALADTDSSVRRAAYESLARLMTDDTAAVWRKALRDPDAALRMHAIGRLETLTDDETESSRALVLAVRDDDAAVRCRAVCVLAAREAIVPSLADAYCETLNAALCAGAVADAPPPTDDSEDDASAAGTAGQASRGTDSWPGALPEPPLIIALVRAVARLFPSGALSTLVAAARYTSAPVRRAAAEALCRKGGNVALAACAELADTEDPDVLRRVATVLARELDPRGLIPAIRAQDECRGAAEAMQRFVNLYPQSRKLDFLITALRAPWSSVKRYAARALKTLESPDCIPPLLEAAKDEDLEVQLAAVEALGKFAKRPEVSARLIGLLDYGDISVREQAIRTLGEHQIAEAVGPLIALLVNPFLRFRAEEALMMIGDRKGFLAIKRRKMRERLFGKKKTKGPPAPLMRKGRAGLQARGARRPKGH
jgi:HEAT repeat protein